MKLIDLGMAAKLDASKPIRGRCRGSMLLCQLVLGSSDCMYACSLKLCGNHLAHCTGPKTHFLQLHLAVPFAAVAEALTLQIQLAFGFTMCVVDASGTCKLHFLSVL